MKNFVSSITSRLLGAAALALALGAAGNAAAGALLHVTIDTSKLEAGTTGFFDFQFNAGTVGTPLATATMTALQGFEGGVFETMGDVSAVAGGYQLGNGVAIPNELWVNAVFGGVFSFNLEFAGDVLPGQGSAFSMNVFDSGWYSVVDLADLNLLDIQWALLDSGPGPDITNNDPGMVTVGDVPAAEVPEPASLLVLALGLALLAVARRQRR